MGRSSFLCYVAVLLLSLHGLPTPSNADEFTDTRVTIQINVDNRGKWCSRHFGKPHKPCTGVFNLRLPRFLPTNETRGNVFRRTWEDTVSSLFLLRIEHAVADTSPPPVTPCCCCSPTPWLLTLLCSLYSAAVRLVRHPGGSVPRRRRGAPTPRALRR